MEIKPETTPVTNDQLGALVLSWAKANHPEKYEATLRVASVPSTFRRYLLRLLELRWEAEPEWRKNAPVLALDETGITARFKQKDGEIIEVKGKKAEPPIEHRWWELGLDRPSYDFLQTAKRELDLEYVND